MRFSMAWMFGLMALAGILFAVVRAAFMHGDDIKPGPLTVVLLLGPAILPMAAMIAVSLLSGLFKRWSRRHKAPPAPRSE